MGLSPYPTPSDAGVLGIILINTAISISIIKHIFLSILHVVGINKTESHEEYFLEIPLNLSEPGETHLEMFQSRALAVQVGTMSGIPKECSVCLAEYEYDDEINQLCCGHVFHKNCLKKWLKRGNVTCPNCRARVMPQDES